MPKRPLGVLTRQINANVCADRELLTIARLLIALRGCGRLPILPFVGCSDTHVSSSNSVRVSGKLIILCTFRFRLKSEEMSFSPRSVLTVLRWESKHRYDDDSSEAAEIREKRSRVKNPVCRAEPEEQKCVFWGKLLHMIVCIFDAGLGSIWARAFVVSAREFTACRTEQNIRKALLLSHRYHRRYYLILASRFVQSDGHVLTFSRLRYWSMWTKLKIFYGRE